jgi:hypothetical protein
MMCKAYMTSYKLPIIITRGNNVYGPHQVCWGLVCALVSPPAHSTASGLFAFSCPGQTVAWLFACMQTRKQRAVDLIAQPGVLQAIFRRAAVDVAAACVGSYCSTVAVHTLHPPLSFLPCLLLLCAAQFPEKMIPKFTLLASRGAELPIHGDGLAVRRCAAGACACGVGCCLGCSSYWLDGHQHASGIRFLAILDCGSGAPAVAVLWRLASDNLKHNTCAKLTVPATATVPAPAATCLWRTWQRPLMLCCTR